MLETHFTPGHGSLPGTAGMETNAPAGRGLSKRVPAMRRAGKEATARDKAGNQNASETNRRFSTENARVKLKPLYP
jgi:hypothetical protein